MKTLLPDLLRISEVSHLPIFIITNTKKRKRKRKMIQQQQLKKDFRVCGWFSCL